MKKLAISLCAFCFSLVLLATVSYAWFVNSTRYTSMKFAVGSVSVSATLDNGVDFNQDGYLDKDDSQQDKYTALGSVGFISSTWGPSNMLPAQYYTYKITVSNIGNMRGGNVSIAVENVQTELAKVLVGRYTTSDSATDVATWSEASLSGTTLEFGEVALAETAGATGTYILQLKIYNASATQAMYNSAKSQATALRLVVSVTV